MFKGVLTPEQPVDVQKYNRPGNAEGGKKKDAVVHFRFLSLPVKVDVFHDFIDFTDL